VSHQVFGKVVAWGKQNLGLLGEQFEINPRVTGGAAARAVDVLEQLA
jgi:hypothetical protein